MSKKINKSILMATALKVHGVEALGMTKLPIETFEKYSINESNFLTTYIYMIESNLINGAKCAVDYNLTLDYLSKLSTNGVSPSPSFMRDYGEDEVGLYLKELDHKVKKYADEI